ncbi:MAG: hypothetical protein Q7S26_02965 [bacterium]|nr:hypothetical protein [bacterium]
MEVMLEEAGLPKELECLGRIFEFTYRRDQGETRLIGRIEGLRADSGDTGWPGVLFIISSQLSSAIKRDTIGFVPSRGEEPGKWGFTEPYKGLNTTYVEGVFELL